MLFRAAVHLGLAAVTAANLVPRDPSRQCAISTERSPALLDDDEPQEPSALRTTNDLVGKSDDPPIEVDVYFHVVAESKKEEDGWISVCTPPARPNSTHYGMGLLKPRPTKAPKVRLDKTDDMHIYRTRPSRSSLMSSTQTTPRRASPSTSRTRAARSARRGRRRTTRRA